MERRGPGHLAASNEPAQIGHDKFRGKSHAIYRGKSQPNCEAREIHKYAPSDSLQRHGHCAFRPRCILGHNRLADDFPRANLSLKLTLKNRRKNPRPGRQAPHGMSSPCERQRASAECAIKSSREIAASIQSLPLRRYPASL